MEKTLSRQKRKIAVNKRMTNSQLYKLAHQTCCWWQSVFVQEKRFFELYYNNDPNGNNPWEQDETQGVFIAEREFLITSLYNAVKLLVRLDKEIQYDSNISLIPVINALSEIVPLDEIKTLRNMNVHRIEYMMGGGDKQSDFRSIVPVDDFNIDTDATITFGTENEVMLGKIPIHKLLPIMKEQFATVKKITNDIFVKSSIAASEKKE